MHVAPSTHVISPERVACTCTQMVQTSGGGKSVGRDDAQHGRGGARRPPQRMEVSSLFSGGLAEHFAFTVKTLERIGVSAVIIEDKVGLKKNSLFGTEVEQQQDDIESFSEKIKVGKAAQATDGFMVIARIESLILEQGVQDALTRAAAYIEAGADGIMIHSRKKDPKEVFDFCRQYNEFHNRRPLVAVPSSYSQVTEKELIANGVDVVIYANHFLRAAYPAMKNVAESILEHRRAYEIEGDLMTINEILELVPGTK